LRGRDDRASPVEVTVKCRIGVDEQVPEKVLPDFLETISEAGVRRVAIHARKAWLQGLSPKENRDIPPLDYPLVHRMKADFPHLHLSINGGIGSAGGGAGPSRCRDGRRDDRARGLSHARRHPRDARMRRSSATPAPGRSAEEVVLAMLPYIEAHLAAGGRLNQITRHMLGLFAGRPGRAAGSASCRKAPIATARGRSWWNAR
jgi:tRNA-dihydrouridine synthase A